MRILIAEDSLTQAEDLRKKTAVSRTRSDGCY